MLPGETSKGPQGDGEACGEGTAEQGQAWVKSGHTGVCLSQGRQAGLPHPAPSVVGQPWWAGSEAVSSWHFPGAHQPGEAAAWRLVHPAGAHTVAEGPVPPGPSVRCKHQGVLAKVCIFLRLWQKVRDLAAGCSPPGGWSWVWPPLPFGSVGGQWALAPSLPRSGHLPEARGTWPVTRPVPLFQTALLLRQAG